MINIEVEVKGELVNFTVQEATDLVSKLKEDLEKLIPINVEKRYEPYLSNTELAKDTYTRDMGLRTPKLQ